MHKFSHNQGFLAARIAFIAAGSVSLAGARETQTQMQVSATVRAVARIELQSAPRMLTITPRDLAQGFVDVPQRTSLAIRSNSAQGYALEFQVLSPLFSAVTVQGLDGEASLGSEGGLIVQRWQHPQAVNLSLSYRFELIKGLAPGEYAWPVQLAVRPLESL